jgi:serine protease Do
MSEFNNVSDTKPKARRHGWKIAIAVISVVLAGALVVTGAAAGVLLVRYLPDSGVRQWLENRPAAPTATAAPDDSNAVKSPSPTLPQIGGDNPLTLAGDVDIPAIVNADGPAIVGVLNKAKGQFNFGRDGNQDDDTQGSGSGVIISADGYVVTNNHVIAGADEISVVLAGGEEVDAKLIGADAQTDLAVLKIEKTGLAVIPFGNSDNTQVGETVLAIGNPLGTELAGTVTAGIISAKNRQITIDGYTYTLMQTDAAINPGNSGGALVNMKGELIGINSLKSTSAGTDSYGNSISAEGIGFAIPINTAKPIIEQLIREGGIKRPVLGISPYEITADQAEFYRTPEGVGIVDVTENGPAMKAGLQAGDIITEFDGKEVKTLADVRNVLNEHEIGDTVKMKVYRSDTGKTLTVDVTLGNSMDLQD